jgi:alpha-glucosidase
MSGVSNTGHDIGGFAGPAPGPELLVRWVAFGIFMPRFSIHSWNDDGTVNEPWMYPEVTAQIAALIKLRYRLIPYLYELLWQSTQAYEPVIRPTFADFPADPRCYEPNDEMMLGSHLLVAPVVEAGQNMRRVHLPAGTRWIDYWRGDSLEGGQMIERPAPWEQPLIFIREGGVIALNVAEQHFDQRADQRGFMVVPVAGAGETRGGCIEDDGETEAWREGQHGRWQIRAVSDPQTVTLHVSREGNMPLDADIVELFIPASETRALRAANARILKQRVIHGWHQLSLQMAQ